VSAAKEQNKQVELFTAPLFSKQWFDNDDQYYSEEDGIPLFSF